MRRAAGLVGAGLVAVLAVPSLADTRVGLEQRAAVSFTVPAPDGTALTLMVEAFQGAAPGSASRVVVRAVPGPRRSYTTGRAYEGDLAVGALVFEDSGARLVTRLGGVPLRVDWTSRDPGFQTAVTTGFAIYHGAELNAPADGLTRASLGWKYLLFALPTLSLPASLQLP